MELKDRLQELRGNISQRKCAENLGVRIANYNKWETGVNIPNYKTLIQIADYYGVTLDYLTGRVDYNDIEYKSSCEQTCLSENALKGLQHIKNSSEHGNIDLFHTLNWLLEKELDPEIERRLSKLQNNSQKHLLELFPVTHDKTIRCSSLSQILYYIAHPDNLSGDRFYSLAMSLQEIVDKSTELTDTEKAEIRDYVHILEDNTANVLNTASDEIAAKILTPLRHEYSPSSLSSKTLNDVLNRTFSILYKVIEEECEC